MSYKNLKQQTRIEFYQPMSYVTLLVHKALSCCMRQTVPFLSFKGELLSPKVTEFLETLEYITTDLLLEFYDILVFCHK